MPRPRKNSLTASHFAGREPRITANLCHTLIKNKQLPKPSFRRDYFGHETNNARELHNSATNLATPLRERDSS